MCACGCACARARVHEQARACACAELDIARAALTSLNAADDPLHCRLCPCDLDLGVFAAGALPSIGAPSSIKLSPRGSVGNCPSQLLMCPPQSPHAPMIAAPARGAVKAWLLPLLLLAAGSAAGAQAAVLGAALGAALGVALGAVLCADMPKTGVGGPEFRLCECCVAGGGGSSKGESFLDVWAVLLGVLNVDWPRVPLLGKLDERMSGTERGEVREAPVGLGGLGAIRSLWKHLVRGKAVAVRRLNIRREARSWMPRGQLRRLSPLRRQRVAPARAEGVPGWCPPVEG
eukprot:6193475-Pleurochrysis_carterae.AAC.6